MAINEFLLLAVGTARIQKYIFNSNRLQENIGASQLVASITGEWAFDAIRKTTSDHNINDKDHILDKPIESSTVDAEVLYSGGGNFVALFRNTDAVKVFTRNLSRRALKDAPGLHLVIHSVPFIWGEDVFQKKLDLLFQEMKENRSILPNVMPTAGLGVTVMCQSTALPAVGKAKDNPVSAEVLAKLNAAEDANKRLMRDLRARENDVVYPLDFDDLGRTRGESSLIAVVHADGDGIGEKIKEIGDHYPQPNQARAHINKLRNFSSKLAEASQKALEGTINYLWEIKESKGVSHLFTKQYIPFRPLVFGGDDVTFVCDGRIGLTLTLKYLEKFKAVSGLTACAGIAIVKSHYPFARAYELAEDLCQSAKTFRRESGVRGCYLDWHFTAGGIYGNLSEIRQREYKVKAGSLTLRPVSASGNDMHSWATVAKGLKAFQGTEWMEKRNKTKALREKLRGGRPVVQEFETLYGQNLPSIDGFEHGWSDDGYSGYFDAIELMDLYLPLLQEEKINEPDAAH